MSDVQIFNEIIHTMLDTYERKNKDYGNSFALTYAEYGDVMSAIRLEDKLRRFKQLTTKSVTQQVNDESVDDTLLDLANYAVMTLIERQKKVKESI